MLLHTTNNIYHSLTYSLTDWLTDWLTLPLGCHDISIRNQRARLYNLLHSWHSGSPIPFNPSLVFSSLVLSYKDKRYFYASVDLLDHASLSNRYKCIQLYTFLNLKMAVCFFFLLCLLITCWIRCKIASVVFFLAILARFCNCIFFGNVHAKPWLFLVSVTLSSLPELMYFKDALAFI